MSKAVAWLLGLMLLAAFDSLPAQTVTAPQYLDSRTPIEQRLDDLITRMTTAEKIDQISDKWGSRSVPRLHIPSMLKTEGLHSQSYSTGATIFPQPIAMAATFNPKLIEAVGRQTATESKAAHILVSWSPVLDVARDMRWGRVEETYGESPFLVTQIGLGWIRGFQNDGLIAVPKHFAGHGEPQGGRDSMDLGLSERTMREIHLPSFRAAVEDGKVGGIMAAYSTWDGLPDNASQSLLQGILRQEWGFDGMVVSDCDAVTHFISKHSIADSPEVAAAAAIKAGVNMECGSGYKHALGAALEQGLISEDDLDAAVRPTLRLKMRLGLFEHPEQDAMVWEKLPAYDTTESRALARQVEVEGAVLLKNDKNILPLSKEIRTIAVIGPNADHGQIGDYSPTPAEDQVKTVLQGIRDHVGISTKVLYATGLPTAVSNDTSGIEAAVDAAKKADVAVVVVGDLSNRTSKEQTTGENHDVATLELPGAQRQLIRAVAETGKPLVSVLVNGKPFALPWEAEHLNAILVTWYPGEEGGDATADLLFGDKNPSGRLPVTWPRHAGQLPLNYDYHPSGRRYDYRDLPFSAQYRFGFGLSYTKFQYSNLHVSPSPNDPNVVLVTAEVKNIGARAGDEVAQLYVTDVVASVSTPVIELEGTERIHLEPGGAKQASFLLTPYQLSLLDANGLRKVEPGLFRMHIGGVSPDLPGDVTDRRKLKIAFRDPSEGVSGDFSQTKSYQADFRYTIEAPEQVESGQPFVATVTVRNEGNLSDVAAVRLYSGSLLGSWRFEVKPGETKTHDFSVILTRGDELQLLTRSGIIERKVLVDQSRGFMILQNPSLEVTNGNHLIVRSEANNDSAEPVSETIKLNLDGAVVQELPVKLAPGSRLPIRLSAVIGNPGTHSVQLNQQRAQFVTLEQSPVSLEAPILWISFDEHAGGRARDAISGTALRIDRPVQWVSGFRQGAAQFSQGTTLTLNRLDLYRRSFTLSAWVRINDLGRQGDVALFGGRAPMGAGQDETQTELSAGIHAGHPYFSFRGPTVSGTESVPRNKWTNLVFTYDVDNGTATIYMDGHLSRSARIQPYLGPLEQIGAAPGLNQAAFAIDDVVVLRYSLSASAVQDLFTSGPASVTETKITSNWMTLKSQVKEFAASADVPRGSDIQLQVETVADGGKPMLSQAISLHSGARSYSFSQSPVSGKIRLHARLGIQSGGVGPVLQTLTIGGQTLATREDWVSSSVSRNGSH